MKRICVFILVVLLCLSAAAFAEESRSVEIIKINGISVVVLVPEETMRRARGVAEEYKADFVLPGFLTLIEEEAFLGIDASTVEVSENVVAIEARAFADCEFLYDITIPASVLKIDDTAFEGCELVTVHGTKGSEAERVAKLYGFVFLDDLTNERMPTAPVLPEVDLD